jgi:hypothetical protein
MNPDGLFGPGASQRAIKPAINPMMMVQMKPMAYLVPALPK